MRRRTQGQRRHHEEDSVRGDIMRRTQGQRRHHEEEDSGSEETS